MAIIYEDVPIQEETTVTATPDGADATVEVSPDNEEGASLLEQAADGFVEGSKAVANGAIKSAQATLDLSASVADFASQVWNKGWDEADFNEVDSPIQIPTFDINGAVPGFVEDASQFMFSLAGVNKATPFLKAYKGAGKAAEWGTEFIRGGIADIVGMKATEENLTGSLIKAFPSLEDSILSYIANDGSSDEIEGRLRNALEGMGLGVAVDLGMAGAGKAVDFVMDYLKTARAARKVGSPEELAEALKKEGEVVDASIPEDTTLSSQEKEPPQSEIKAEGNGDKPEGKIESGEEASAVVETPASSSPKPKPEPEQQLLEGSTSKEKIEKLITKVNTGRAHFDTLTPREMEDLLTSLKEAPDAEARAGYDRLSGNVNFQTYAAFNPEGKRFLVKLTDALAEKKVLANSTPETFEDVGRSCALLDTENGTNVEGIAEALYRATGSTNAAKAFRAQAAVLLPALTRKAASFADRYINSRQTISVADRMEFIKVFNDIQKLWVADKNFGTATARALNSRKYTGGPIREGLETSIRENPKAAQSDLVDIFRLFDGLPSDIKTEEDFWKWCSSHNISQDSFDKVVEAVSKTRGNPKAMFNQMKALKQGSWSKFAVYWFTQNILSSPFTHLWNIGGNITKVADMSVGRLAFTGGKALLTQQGKEEFREALRFTQGLCNNIGNAWKLALSNDFYTRRISSKSYDKFSSKFSDGDVVGENAPASYEYIRNLITKGDEKKELTWAQNLLAHFIHYTGAIARYNSRIMAAEDDFFKQLVFLSQRDASITMQLDGMKITDPKERAEAFKKLSDDWFTDEGIVNVNNPRAAEALRSAEYSTYSQDVTTQWVRALHQASNQSPILKVVAPFIKTVWNVQIDALEHSPLAGLSKQWRNDVVAGGLRRQEAWGRAASGTMFLGLGILLADEGIITGALSSDKSKKEAQIRAGVRPYSIRIGDTYISYDRLDPFGCLLGLVADFTNIIRNSEEMEAAGLEMPREVVSAVLSSFVKTMGNKSFLSSMTDFFKIFDSQRDPGEAILDFSWDTTKAFMPGSGLFRAAANTASGIMDVQYERPETLASYGLDIDVLRLANTLALRAKSTPIKYDWFTGESQGFRGYLGNLAGKDWVDKEMERIGWSIIDAPSRNIDGVRLTTEQYSRLCQLHGTLKLHGLTLKERVRQLMETPSYDINEEWYSYAPDGQGKSRRGEMVNRIIRAYRDAAKRHLLEEFPDLQAEVSKAKAQKRLVKRGQPASGTSSTKNTRVTGITAEDLEMLKMSLR